MHGLILVEGLPGSGKSTTAEGLARWLTEECGHPAQHWPEGRIDHPVDFEQVSVLTADQLRELRSAYPDAAGAVRNAATADGERWLVRRAAHPELPAGLLDELSRHDAYDGEIDATTHHEVLSASWERFGSTPPLEATQVWECVLIQNPVCTFVARFDQPAEALQEHVAGLVDSVAEHRPALVYLDMGDPAEPLARAAEERPAEWLDAVIRYHTEQGWGLRNGLTGFDGYVEFMRHRREVELDLLSSLRLPTLVVDGSDWDDRVDRIRAFTAEHLG